MDIEDRKKKEIEHSDKRRAIVRGHEYLTDAAAEEASDAYVAEREEYAQHFSNMKFYSITRESIGFRDALLFDGIAGAVALDYCCGNGEMAIEMAKRGASKVCGIDISQVAVDNARALAESAGVADRCEFKVMDAEHTEFLDGTFDVIHEYGALHHLELPAAFRELSRILKPGGKLICTETLRHNPLIRWYRRRTPHLRTEWEVEHILGIPEIESGREYFAELTYRTFHLTALGAVPFRKSALFSPLLAGLNFFDRVLLALPLVKRMAWITVAQYGKPRKGDDSRR